MDAIISNLGYARIKTKSGNLWGTTNGITNLGNAASVALSRGG